jgi:hypothetical protein
MTADIAALRLQIEALRRQFNRLITAKALTDPEMIRASQELDELLNQYQRLLNENKI